MGIQAKDGQARQVVIPKGALITARRTPADSSGLIECLWDGAEIMVLAEDILERGVRIQPAPALPEN